MVLVDLDNCISDDRWRVPLINHDAANDFLKFHPYHMAIPGDAPGNLHILQGEVVLITSRPIKYQWLTASWLQYHKIRYQWLLMRQESDAGLTSPEVKRKALHALLKSTPKRHITMAYDDRPDVIAMYESEGIPATHMYINHYDWKEWYGENSSRDSRSDGFHL